MNIHFFLVKIFLLFNLSLAFSQNQPKHELKTLVGEDGKVYWNKKLPAYIHLSTSPGGGADYVMKAESAKETEPYYFDTEGTNWIRTRWATDKETGKAIMPQREEKWPVQVDGLSPNSKASFKYEGKYTVNGKTFVSGDLTITLSATDAVSGVDGIYYSTGADWKKYNAPFQPGTEKDWNLKFYAVDKVGNAESLDDNASRLGGSGNNIAFTVDKTAPVTTISASAPKLGDVLSPKSKITLTSNDAGAGVKSRYYSLDEKGKAQYFTPLIISALSDGEHTIKYFATDYVKNEETAKTYSFYLDKTPPELSFSVEGDQYTSSNGQLFVSERSKLKLTGTDNKAGLNKMFYNLDATSYNEYSNTIPTAGQAQKLHWIYYYGDDKVENTSKKFSKPYILDNKAPKINYTALQPQYKRKDTLFVRDITKFTIKPVDYGKYESGVKQVTYTVSGGTETAYTDAFTISGDGAKTLTIKAVDQVGNESSKQQVIFVDNKPPVIHHEFSIEPIGTKTVKGVSYNIYPPETKLFLSDIDEHVGSSSIFYRINGGPEKPYVHPIAAFKVNTNVKIDLRTADILGNESTDSFSFSIE